jgi:uncharacterized protein YciU (UPF0263 family)
MKQPTFLTYHKSSDRGEVIDIGQLLTAKGIECQFEDNSTTFDPSFANNEFSKEFRIKIQQQDFEKADEILLEFSAQKLEDIDADYYLFSFSNQELLELITKSDEWSKFDYLLAQKILKDRGQEVSGETIDMLKEERIATLSKPNNNQKSLVITGYFFVLLGGIIAIFIGWHIWTHKKTLPNGDSVYGYTEKGRKHGRIIFILGIVFLILIAIEKIKANF